MDRAVQRERHTTVNNFVERNADKLLSWAYTHGLQPRTDEDIPYIKAEIIGRVLACKAVRIISGFTGRELVQMPIGNNYDIESPTGTHLEVKFKYNDDDEYTSDDITLHKKELNEGLNYTGATQVIIPFWNGVVRCYDMMAPAKTGTWTRNEKTVVESDAETEENLKYMPEQKLWEVRITMPEWDKEL